MLKIVFTSEDNENSMFGIEEFPISAEHASQLMRGDMCIERFLNDNLNAPDDISRFKGLLLEGDTIDHMLQLLSNLNQNPMSKKTLKSIWLMNYGKPYMILFVAQRIP